MNMKSGVMAMFASLKRENIPLDCSSLGHYNLAPDIMISNWLSESSSCEASQIAHLSSRHDVSDLILQLDSFRERAIMMKQLSYAD